MTYSLNNVRSRDNLKLAFNRIITNPESTYKNYFRELYTAYTFSLDDNIKALSSKIHVGYIPCKAIKTFLPKSNGLNRMYTLLSVEDQIVYQAYCNIIAQAICNSEVKARHRKTVFGNIFAGDKSSFLYKRWQDSYKLYTKAIIKTFNNGYHFVANFDLTACYDSINHILLREILVNNNLSENLVDEFISLLRKWTSTADGCLGIGIPQGPISSGIIAEAVLEKYDQFLEKLQKSFDFKYFRYVDDIKILAKDYKTAEWILFLLDVKSKELGLFPQTSKVGVKMITDINSEVKRISLPLYEDDIDDEEKPEKAYKRLQGLVNKKSEDITTIRRLFGEVECNYKVNRLYLKALKQYPNLIHSFAFYITRYPRQLPKTISNFIEDMCEDGTKQFAAGLLLQNAHGKFSINDYKRFSELAKKKLKNKKNRSLIMDPLFKAELYGLLISYCGINSSTKKHISEMTWWEKQQLISILRPDSNDNGYMYLINSAITSEHNDVALIAAKSCVENNIRIPKHKISDYNNTAQLVFQNAGIIKRKKTTSNQVNKCVEVITENKTGINWKRFLKHHYNAVEESVYLAQIYWQTDLTSFVNIWDTIDDTIFDELSLQYNSVIGGHNLGNFGFLECKKFKLALPNYQKLCSYVHDLRLHSTLSHMYISDNNTPTSEWKCTHPISSRERKIVKRLINNAMIELYNFLYK